mmetsp:Transcript_46665/g.134405  ORF Transcript_46665/g.134405 Transcript_46665/m.134405 type:complete len:220 (-) Transcript_46665:718-1377(-)
MLLVPDGLQSLVDVLRRHLQVRLALYLASAVRVRRPLSSKAPVRRPEALGADHRHPKAAALLRDARRIRKQGLEDLDLDRQHRIRGIAALDEPKIALETAVFIELMRRQENLAQQVCGGAPVVVEDPEGQALAALENGDDVLLVPCRLEGLANVPGLDLQLGHALDLASAEGVRLAAAQRPVRSSQTPGPHDRDLQAAALPGHRGRRREPQQVHPHLQG